jgi:hypothetical protein
VSTTTLLLWLILFAIPGGLALFADLAAKGIIAVVVIIALVMLLFTLDSILTSLHRLTSAEGWCLASFVVLWSLAVCLLVWRVRTDRRGENLPRSKRPRAEMIAPIRAYERSTGRKVTIVSAPMSGKWRVRIQNGEGSST